jgi:phosphoglycolate phosphatase
MLILFDIDGTLLLTGGIGRRAMQQAGSEMLGRPFNAHGVDFSGRLDPLILADLLAINGIEPTEANLNHFRDHYIKAMTQAIESSGAVQPLPGADTLVSAVGQVQGLTTGVLTGNFMQTGTAKLKAAGWSDTTFTIAVWGDESPTRPHSRDQLPGVALTRYSTHLGAASVTGEQAVVIGDTIHDVACARAHGCRSIAVATGTYSTDQLRQAGADLVLDTLEDTDLVLGWLAQAAG